MFRGGTWPGGRPGKGWSGRSAHASVRDCAQWNRNARRSAPSTGLNRSRICISTQFKGKPNPPTPGSNRTPGRADPLKAGFDRTTGRSKKTMTGSNWTTVGSSLMTGRSNLTSTRSIRMTAGSGLTPTGSKLHAGRFTKTVTRFLPAAGRSPPTRVKTHLPGSQKPPATTGTDNGPEQSACKQPDRPSPQGRSKFPANGKPASQSPPHRQKPRLTPVNPIRRPGGSGGVHMQHDVVWNNGMLYSAPPHVNSFFKKSAVCRPSGFRRKTVSNP
jgi:hypothetical protein